MDARIDMTVPHTDTVANSQIPSFCYEMTSSALMTRAREVTAYLGGDPASVRPRPEERANYAFFEVTLADGDYFLKLLRAPDTAATWQERDNAVFAASHGWGPAALAPARFPDALLTRLIAAQPMAWYEAAQPTVWPTLLRGIKTVHDSLGSLPADAEQDLTAGAQGRLIQLRDKHLPEILNLDDLQERIKLLRAEMSKRSVTRVFCHRDFHMGNVLANDAQLWIIDWEYADWSDPWMEVARFAALAHISSAQAPGIVEAYTQQTASPEDVRYVRLCMAAVNVEFFVHNYRLNGLTPMTLRYLQAVYNDGAALDLPIIRNMQRD